ncbi:hypothetical protein [Crossiella sp. CA198]|uniref:hypothetical protein n=1 Tax=Crossiella sp. CA198 TaxID=3455607 RepID=UPI003F8D86FE
MFTDDNVPHGYSPDGLTLADINVLIWEVSAELRKTPPPVPTTALLDGSARAKRDRRIVRRQLHLIVSALPTTRALPAETGTEAA